MKIYKSDLSDTLSLDYVDLKKGYLTLKQHEGESVIVYIEYNDAFRERMYSRDVEKLIREKYSLSEELAILRQRDTKPEEFAEYNNFAETCKKRAKGV